MNLIGPSRPFYRSKKKTSFRIFTLFAHNLAKVGHINRLEWAMEQGIAKNIGGHPNKY
jgi:hypothetical protein